jgi:hypothetical protein
MHEPGSKNGSVATIEKVLMKIDLLEFEDSIKQFQLGEVFELPDVNAIRCGGEWFGAWLWANHMIPSLEPALNVRVWPLTFFGLMGILV